MAAEKAHALLPSKFALAFALAVPVSVGLFLLVTSVSQPLPNLLLYDAKRVLEIALFAFLSALLVCSPSLRQASAKIWARTPAFVPLILLGVIALGSASAFRLTHPAYALVDVAQLAIWSGMVVLAASARLVAGRWFDRAAMIAVSLLGLGVFLQEASGFAAYAALGEQFQYREALIRFIHPRYFNQVQTWTLPVLAALPMIFPERARFLRIAAAMMIGFQWYLMLMTGARGSIVAVTGALLVMALWLPAARRHWWKSHLAGLLIGIAIYSAALGVLSASGKQAGDGAFFDQSVGRPVMHTTGRSLLWRDSLNDIRTHPWLGTGPMHYACDGTHDFSAHPHNFALQMAGEWGLPAATLLGGLIAWLLWRALLAARKRPTEPRAQEGAVCAMLLAGVMAAAAHLMVSGLLITPASQVTGFLVTGWLLALSLRHASGESAQFPRWSGLALGALLLGLSLALSAFARVELPRMEERAAYVFDKPGPSTPRFWTDGRVCRYAWPEATPKD